MDVQAVAAADLGGAQFEKVLVHRGSARHRYTLQFEVQWANMDVTWEPWESARKLNAVNKYIVQAIP